MKDYIYDGSFEGLLCCVFAAYYDAPAASICTEDRYQTNMLAEPVMVETDAEKAARVYDAVKQKISGYDLKRIYRVYLSSDDEKEMKILRYLQLGFKKGSYISNLHGNDVVFAVQKIEKQVSFEVHRLYGLVRFSELAGGVMYSCIEPDHDVIELMAAHFADRFQTAPFILHDKRRNKAIFSQGGSWFIGEFTEAERRLLEDADKTEKENAYRQMWKAYFEHIAIKERTNRRCQKNLMPVRYWKYLTELQP